VWGGLEPLGEHDGRLALYLTDHVAKLRREPTLSELGELPGRERVILAHLEQNGASFFATLHGAAGGGYPGETVDAIWTLVWAGAITNDSLHAVRAFTRPADHRSRKPKARAVHRTFRSRRMAPPTAEGRWSLMSARAGAKVSATESATALAQQLLARYGVLTREVAATENIPGGFSAVYNILKALEDAGRIRRGYFASEVGATQFALPAALDLLRSLKDLPDEPDVVVLAATDPANPYGTILRWPDVRSGDDRGRAPTRSAGSLVAIVNGALAAYISRGARQLLAFLPEDEPARSTTARALAATLARLGLLVHEVNGLPAAQHPLSPYLVEAGFSPSAMGFQIRHGGFGRGA
jgi:ATP-dependent Lhr-like helicase